MYKIGHNKWDILRRDEDGKTPLDKARERNDEGHREVSELIVKCFEGFWIRIFHGNLFGQED